MEEELFDALHAHAERHWWFRSRQRIVRKLLDRHFGVRVVHPDAMVLDLGCGAGTNLRFLERYGRVSGADPSPKALDYCRQRFNGPLAEVWLPDQLPYGEKSFDLVVMLDVLEHVENDIGALQRVLRLLKPGGTLLLTVPALRWLWSYHDIEHHHFRRYHRGALRRKLTRLGFEVSIVSYINFFLLPLMASARMLLRPKNWSAKDLASGVGVVGRVFEPVFSFERHILGFGTLPIGGSLVAVVRRPPNLELPPWTKGLALPTRAESKRLHTDLEQSGK